MKKTLLLLIFWTVCMSASALSAPVSYRPVELSQPDGTPVELFVSGDEFYRWVHDANGYPVQRDPDGWILYVGRRGPEPELSAIPVGLGDPVAMGLAIEPGPPDLPDAVRRIVDSRVEIFRAARNPAGVRTPRIGGPFRGTINELVIFVRFNDEDEFVDDLAVFDSMFNGSGPDQSSMGSYFREVSYGRLSVQAHMFPATDGTTVVSYRDSKPRRYFQWAGDRNPDGYYNENDGYYRLAGMLDRAIAHVKTQVPADLDIDLDNDGLAENVVFILSGDAGEWADALWPHSSILMYDRTINGARLFQYNLQFRDWLLERAVGVLAHEFFHAIGSPDLYHYSHDSIDPAGPWDLMENTAEPPQHMTAWMKYRYGAFIDEIPLVTEPGRYTLNPLLSGENNSIKIPVPGQGQKYQSVVVEYRKKSGVYESSLPGEGLIAYRVDELENGNAEGPPDELYIFRPGGGPTQNGDITRAALDGTGDRTSLTARTDPYLFAQNGDPIGIRIYDISTAGETISFSVCPNVPDCIGIECGDDGCGGSCGSCDDGNDCTLDQCVDGACQYVHAPATTPCNQGLACAAAGVCSVDGVCLAAVPVDCVDGNECTVDSCADGFKWVDLGQNRFEDLMPTDANGAGVDGDQFVAGDIPIGFDFPFMGGMFGFVKVYDNGLIGLSTDAGVDMDDLQAAMDSQSNTPIPSESGPDNFIALFWDDLVCRVKDRCVVAYKTIGQAPDRRFVVQFNKVRRVAVPGRLMDFQAALFEDGRIELRYGDLGGEDGISATVGIEGQGGTTGYQYSSNQHALRSNMTLSLTPGPYQCINRPIPDHCLIGGACVSKGTLSPDNPCAECRPLVDLAGWSADDANPCDDVDACTRADICRAGVCMGTDPVVCKPLNQCYFTGKCDPGTGLCDDPIKDDGTRCNADNNGCSVGDYCQAGDCKVGLAADCSGKDAECAVGKCVSRSSNAFKCEQDKTSMAGRACGRGPDVCRMQDTCDDRGVCRTNPLGDDVQCRSSRGECDMPEFCDGEGACPGDLAVEDRSPCGWRGDGMCVDGDCVAEPVGVACPDAVELIPGQVRRGSASHAGTAGDAAAVQTGCLAGAVGWVWFRVDLDAGVRYQVSVAPVGGANLAVGIVETCESDVCDGLVDLAGPGDVEFTDLSGGSGRTVLLRVISMDSVDDADFSVSVKVVDGGADGDAVEPADVLSGDNGNGSDGAGCSAATLNGESSGGRAVMFLMAWIVLALAGIRFRRSLF